MEIPDFLEPAKAAPEVQANASLIGKVAEMRSLRMTIDAAEERIKVLRQRYDSLRKIEIPEMMHSMGMVSPDGKGKFTTAEGQTVFLRNELYVHCSGERKTALFEWLENNGFGSLIRPDVHPQTLKAFVREQMERGAVVPPSVTVYHETSAVISA